MFIVSHGSWDGFREVTCFSDKEDAIRHGDLIQFDEEDYESGWVKVMETNELECSAKIVWERYF